MTEGTEDKTNKTQVPQQKKERLGGTILSGGATRATKGKESGGKSLGTIIGRKS